jgi:hypothetical protein
MQNDKARHAMYAKVEIARQQLPGMEDDDFYRNWLAEHFFEQKPPFAGKRSRKDLTFQELQRLVDLLARLGARYTSKASNKRRERPRVRPDFIEIQADDPNAATKRMICAIWRKLGYSMTGLETRVERQTGILSILGLHDEQALSAILADLRRREKSFEKRAASECTA